MATTVNELMKNVLSMTLMTMEVRSGVYCTFGTLSHDARPALGGVRVYQLENVLPSLQEARTQGGHMGVLHASSLGLSVYKNLGFETFCEFELFPWGHQYMQQ